MTQNTSHAVMAQRHEPHDSLDDFPTPPWAGRALCEHVVAIEDGDLLWEPAANRGFLLRGLKDYFHDAYASDIHDYGAGFPLNDFLLPGGRISADWIVTNPPFRLAEQFARRGLECGGKGVALLVRTAFLEGAGRYRDLFRWTPPHLIGQFVERVPMVKGRCDPLASTATSYCWLVWLQGVPHGRPEFVWIPPCRRKLERPGDYDLPLEQAA